jgi:hypothetical protein
VTVTRSAPLLALALVACTAEVEETGGTWMAPDLVLADRDGVEHALADHEGEAVLLMNGAFW